VYLPAGGRWERVVVSADGSLRPTGDVQAGGRSVTAPAPLADIPVYRRVVAAAGRAPAMTRPQRRPAAHRRARVNRSGPEAARATVAAGTSGTLPFTGLELLALVGAGTLLLAAGLGLRRTLRRVGS
jgi:hypothetical protein